MEGPHWKGVSADAKDMVRELLMTDVTERPTAEEALELPWLANHYRQGNLKELDLPSALTNIQDFDAGTRLKQGVLAFFSKFLLTQKERDTLTSQFKAIDTNGDGTLSREELIAAYR